MKNLIIEITSRCNLSCTMCLRQTWSEKTGDMDMETFKGLTPVFETLDSINLSGYGEPFLNPYLIDMILLAKKHVSPFCRINLTTNGMVVDRSTTEDVIKAGLDGISFSIDSFVSDKFTALRQGGSLEVVIECLENFLAVRKKLKKESFEISISFVAMERNIRELPRLIQFATDHQVNSIWVNNLLPPNELIAKEILYDSHSQEVLENLTRAKERLQSIGVNPSIFRLLAVKLSTNVFRVAVSNLSPEEKLALQCLQEVSSEEDFMGGILSKMLQVLERDGTKFYNYMKIFEECQKLAASRELTLHLPLIIPRAKRECNFIKNQACFITWDGWVRPCNQLSHEYSCFHYGRPKRVKSISFGKVPEEDLEAIWNSQPYQTFRRNVEEFRFSPCGDCGLSDGCGYIAGGAHFIFDCNVYEQPCGDCLWSRGILQCP